MVQYRPSGPIQWLFSKLPQRDWYFSGCISTEERSTSAALWFSQNVRPLPEASSIAWINDTFVPDVGLVKALKQQRLLALNATSWSSQRLSELDLLATPALMQGLFNGTNLAGHKSILLDITSFPKRFFFYLVRLLLSEPMCEDLVITYTIPRRYAQTLAGDPQSAMALPTFVASAPDQEIDLAIVGVGFEPLGLADALQQHQARQVRVMLPFPSAQDAYIRNLEFVGDLERRYGTNVMPEPDRVNGLDCSACFDAICAMTANGTRTSLIAPYGPKPMSLAMCLFSLAVAEKKLPQVPAYYAQPRSYAPDYSSGVAVSAIGERILSYVVKWDGQRLYAL